MTTEEFKGNHQTPEPASFSTKLTPLLTDLFYPGESDEPVEPITCYLGQVEPLLVTQIKEWLMVPPSVYVEETSEAGFWAPVVTEEDWYGDDEKTRTAKFQQLKQLLEAELTVRQVFRVGEGETDVYLLGRQANGERTGLKTKVVET